MRVCSGVREGVRGNATERVRANGARFAVKRCADGARCGEDPDDGMTMTAEAIQRYTGRGGK